MTDIEELKRLAQAATPGPWAQRVGHGSVWSCALEALGIRVCDCAADDYDGDDDEEAKAQAKATAAYIAAANPQAVMALIERLETLEAERKGTARLTLEQLLQIEWCNSSRCPVCDMDYTNQSGAVYYPGTHSKKCWLAAAIREAQDE